MPFRAIATLQSWVDEFNQDEHPGGSTVRVIPQDGAERADAGRVAVRIPGSPTEIVIAPSPSGPADEWSITFEPREAWVTVQASEVASMAEAIAALAELCTFLQKKSDESSSG